MPTFKTPREIYEEQRKRPRTYYSGTKYKHTGEHEYDRPVRVRRKPGGRGYVAYHPRVAEPKLSEIIKDIEKVRSDTFTLGVLGRLAEDYDSGGVRYRAFEHNYLARIKRTDSTLRVMKAVYAQVDNDQYQLRELLSDLMGMQWSTVDTVYVTERGPIA